MQNKSVKYSSSVVLWTLPYIQEPNFHTETLWKHVHFSSKATNMGRVAMVSCVPEQFPNCRMLARKLAQYWSGTLAGHPATFGNTLQKCGSSPQGMKTGWPDLTSFSNPLARESEAEKLSRPEMQGAASQNCVTNSKYEEGKENIKRNVLKSWNCSKSNHSHKKIMKIDTPGQDPFVKSLIFVLS